MQKTAIVVRIFAEMELSIYCSAPLALLCQWKSGLPAAVVFAAFVA
jgi:hypothetical protein